MSVTMQMWNAITAERTDFCFVCSLVAFKGIVRLCTAGHVDSERATMQCYLQRVNNKTGDRFIQNELSVNLNYLQSVDRFGVNTTVSSRK